MKPRLPSIDADALSRLLATIYDAALEPNRWSEAMDALARAVGWSASTLQVNDMRSQSLIDVVFTGMPEEAIADYQNHFFRVDPRISQAPKVAPDTVICDADILSEGEMDRHEFYADLMARYDLRYFAGASLAADGPIQTVFSVQRAASGGPASAAEIALLQALTPHVRRAVRLGVELGAARLRADTAAEALERLSLGIAILDAAGAVLFANAALRAMAEAQDGLSLGAEGLRFGHRVAQAAATRLIAGAIATSRGQGIDAGGTAQMSRPSGKRPYRITVSPMPARGPIFLAARPGAAVLVTDPDVIAAPPAETLRGLYRLTPREAEVALALAAGTPLVRATERLA